MKKRILGLDLGVSSIGWALVETDDQLTKTIIALGSRIIPLSTDEKDEFGKGSAISKNQQRTLKRTQRRGYFRYKLRRKKLLAFLELNSLKFTDELLHCSAISLYSLRTRALKEKISLPELGRVLYHLNQKRGYKSSRSDVNLDKKDTEYVAEVKNRYQQLQEANLTIGQHCYQGLLDNQYYRIRQQVFPREAYKDEFDAILLEQQKHYPDILTADLVLSLRDEIIYYQRRLKSQKGLVSICELEGAFKKDKNGKEVFAGPKVMPRSSPLFQVGKIWESINTITLKNKKGEILQITDSQRLAIFNYLDSHKLLSESQLYKILGLKKGDGWYGNRQIAKGLQGNLTKTAIKDYLPVDNEQLLQFDLTLVPTGREAYLIDKSTGEVITATAERIVTSVFEQQPLYRLWHTIYSISDAEECIAALRRIFGLSRQTSELLTKLDFVKSGFGNKSARATRKILPYLQEGYVYSSACSFAGYNHSNSLTKEEIERQPLLPRLELLKKNSLRQPVVEKILNQVVNLVNAILEKYGKPDEICIELARELKQSKEERNDAFIAINKRERDNKIIIERIEKEYSVFGVRATRNTIIKWRLFHEIVDQESKLNAVCIYCGKPFGLTDTLSGNSVDIEHIIPKSRLFDDSQSNKTLVHRRCNEDKGNATAFDFMCSKGETALAKYLETIDYLYKNKVIGKTKRDKLLMPADKIPKDFIDRQLRETQYIARKAKELLENICNKVWSTSGSITEYLRRIWGWDEVLMNLHLSKYRESGLTEIKKWHTADGQQHDREEIKGWSKRDDHRHHAIDALVIACTQQSFIQRINTLNSNTTRQKMQQQIENQQQIYDIRKSLLENFIHAHKPFSTSEIMKAAEGILVSFKAGKRVATITRKKATGKNLNTGVLVPRGPLSEESLYGKIHIQEIGKPVKYLFEKSHLIFKPYIKTLVEERLSTYAGNVKQAIASLKKEPIYLDADKTKILEYGTCFKEAYVIKYQLAEIKAKDLPSIIDKKIRAIVKKRLDAFNNNEKEAFKTTLWFNEALNIPINSIRCFTGLAAVVPLRKDSTGKDIGFVKPGNNHHIAIYIDEKGEKREHICTFWHAVERKKYRLPPVIENPAEVWDSILSNDIQYPENFLTMLPKDNWNFKYSFQQNEAFLLGLSDEDANQAFEKGDAKLISKHLYITWSISGGDYRFRHHLETRNSDLKQTIGAAETKRFYRCNSIKSFFRLNPIKVRLNVLGELTINHRYD